MRIEGQLGSVDPRAFDAAFQAVLGDLQRCHIERLQRIRYLAGDLKIFLRLAEDGAVKQAFVEDSTLGDHEAEACILQIVGAKRWPAPLGGEGEVHKSVGFDAPGNVRAPTVWGSDQITPALVANNAKIRACRGGIVGTFKATGYVVAGPPPRPKGGDKGGKTKAKPVGGRRPSKPSGHLVAVGIAPPGREGTEVIGCLVEALKQMSIPSPGADVAKVTFSL